MDQITRNMSVLLLSSASLLGVSACNTIHGAGEDVEKVGDKIQQEANEHKDDDGATDSSIDTPMQ